jgi:hypothetical protein
MQLTTAPIFLAFSGIRELDSNFTEVGQNSTPKHSYVDFANLGASQMLSTAVNSTLPSSGIQARCQDAVLVVPVNNATIRVTVCGILSNGTQTVNGQSTQMFEGQFQLSIQISNWIWCSSCTGGQNGNYLELNLTLAVPLNRQIMTVARAEGQPVKFDLGTSDSYSLFSTLANWTQIPTGYPMLIQTNPAGPKAVVSLRLPRPVTKNTTVEYYPVVIEPGYTIASQPPAVSGAPTPRFLQTSTSAGLVVFLLVALFATRI